MKVNSRWHRGMHLFAAVMVALVTVAPIAEAGHGNGRGNGHAYGRNKQTRYKDTSCETRVVERRYVPRTRVVETRYEPRYRSYRTYRSYGSYPRTRYVQRSSNAGPVIGAFIGGLILGTVISNSQACPSGYYYDDPYCNRRFHSLSGYRSHCSSYHHSTTVRVISVETNRCVRTYGYHDGRWIDRARYASYDHDQCSSSCTEHGAYARGYDDDEWNDVEYDDGWDD